MYDRPVCRDHGRSDEIVNDQTKFPGKVSKSTSYSQSVYSAPLLFGLVPNHAYPPTPVCKISKSLQSSGKGTHMADSATDGSESVFCRHLVHL